MKWYSLYDENGTFVTYSHNKKELIKRARKMDRPATVNDDDIGGIIYENKAQRILNNM